MNYTYIVQCADGTLYTGWTNCLEKRLKAHNSGKNGAKYTKTKRPVTLVYYEGYATKEEAMSREYAIKQLTFQHPFFPCRHHQFWWWRHFFFQLVLLRIRQG